MKHVRFYWYKCRGKSKLHFHVRFTSAGTSQCVLLRRYTTPSGVHLNLRFVPDRSFSKLGQSYIVVEIAWRWEIRHLKLQWKYTLARQSSLQCDQIRQLLKGLGGKFSYTNRPNFWQLFRLFLKTLVFSLNCFGYFCSTFGRNLATFYSNICSHWLPRKNSF